MDGFRFDLASALCRDPRGQPMAAPPLIKELAKDPVLSKVQFQTPLNMCQTGKAREASSERPSRRQMAAAFPLPLSIKRYAVVGTVRTELCSRGPRHDIKAPKWN